MKHLMIYLILLLLIILNIKSSLIQASAKNNKKISIVRQCQISVQHAKVIQIRPKVVKILCHPGYSTSTGQNGLLIRCKKKLRNAKLNFCYPKSQKYSHPYPLFQSDDPKIDDNIILLDNNDAVKKTGVYNIEDDENDYSDEDYEYKGYDEDYDENKDYGSYYDYDYDKSKDYPEHYDDMITDNEDDYHNYDQIITENPTVTNSKPENESSEVLENDQDLEKIHENMTNFDDDSITTKVIENVENIDEKLESTTTVTSLDFDLKPDINEEGVTEPNIDETTTEKPIIEKPEYEDDFDDISITISNNDVVSSDNPNEQHIDYNGVEDDYEEQTENSKHFPNSSEDDYENFPEDISDTNSPEDNSDNLSEDNSDNSPEDNPYNSAKDNSDNSHEDDHDYSPEDNYDNSPEGKPDNSPEDTYDNSSEDDYNDSPEDYETHPYPMTSTTPQPTTITSETTKTTTTTTTSTTTTTTTTTRSTTASQEEDDYEDEDDYDDEDYYDEDYDDDDDDYEEEDTSNNGGTESETELIYRNYEILSDFYKKHFVDLRVLDTSCEPTRVPPPKIERGFIQEYLTTENVLLPGQHYHEVVYNCDPGYKLADSSLGHMFCQQQGWMGVEPYCEDDPNAESIPENNFTENDSIEEAFEECEEDLGCDYKCKIIENEPKCICQNGYILEDFTACIDIDECLGDNGGCQYSCVNKPGTFQCECPPGYLVDDLRCVDENECVSNNGHGPCQDTCLNTEGSFQCACDGLPGTILSADGNSCEEIDLCKENNGGCSHDCHTSYGQSFCMCPTGMKLDIDWKTCIAQNGNSGIIEEKIECQTGYIRDIQKNQCIDIDECENSPCGANGLCINEQPGYICDCVQGYEFDGTTCKDTNECLDNTCQNGVCINHEGSFQCKCFEGYHHDSNGICVDINECEEENICESGQCINLDGGYDCDCDQGYENRGGVCTDINECKQTKCGRGAYCNNTDGSYECKCKRSDKIYDSTLKKCKKINCPPNTCSKHGKCVKEDSGFKCICKPGYSGSKCDQDINECKISNPCQHKCENTLGSFKCHCPKGYKIDPQEKSQCIDINECDTSTVICQNGKCINTDGSYRCECIQGYFYDELTEKCIMEPDECIQKCSHSCGPNGICICPKGYILNPDNNLECIRKRKRKKKKKKISGCPEYNSTSTSGIQISYTKDLNTSTLLYPRGTTVKGKCLSGYKNSGKLKKRCKKDGSWRGSDLNCTLITCPAITNLEAGVIVEPESCNLESSLVKQKCQFSCADPQSFKLIGSKSVKCKKNGTWRQKGGNPMCVEKKKKKKSKKKQRKKKHKNNQHLGHPLSTVGMPPISNIKTSATSSSSTTSSTTTTTTSTTMPPWPSTTPWYQMPQTSLTPTRSSSTTTTLTTTTRPTPTPWSTQPSRPPRPLPTTSIPYYHQITPVFPAPFIYCPPDVIKDLPSLSANISAPKVFIRIPQPKTNVNWYEYVKSYPPWAKNLEVELGLGKTLVTFTASSPISQDIASCSFTIHVRDIIPPRVYNCPNDFDVYLDEGQIEKQIYWDEPIFADNVKIAHVMASKLPGYKMKAGRHDVLYQAADADGNKARCVFTVTVWDSSKVNQQVKSWVLCRIGKTGRQIKLYLSHVPLGCEKLS